MTENRLKSGSSFFRLPSEFIHCFYGWRWCNVSFSLHAFAFRRQELRFKCSFKSAFKYSLDLFFIHYAFCFFDGQFMRSSRKHRKIYAGWVRRMLWSLRFINTDNLQPKKMQLEKIPSPGQFSKSGNSIVFIIPAQANYLEFSSPSSHNFFSIRFSSKAKMNFQLRILPTKCNCV